MNNLKSSSAVGQAEINNVKKNMGTSYSNPSGGMSPGSGNAGYANAGSASLGNSTAVGQGEIQNVKQNMGGNYSGANSGQPMNYGYANGTSANLSNSTAVGQEELRKVREEIQKSGFQNSSTLS